MCWIGLRDTEIHRYPQGIQIHEIIGGAMRSLEPCNYATVCSKCHDSYHSRGDGLTLAELLYAKWESTCLEVGAAVPYRSIVAVGGEVVWNPYRLAFLRRPQRTPPSLSALPLISTPCQRYLLERCRFRPFASEMLGLTESQLLNLGPGSADSEPTTPPIIQFTASNADLSGCCLRAGKLADWKGLSSILSS